VPGLHGHRRDAGRFRAPARLWRPCAALQRRLVPAAERRRASALMDPVTLSGLALTGLSTAFNAFAARRVDEARARFMRAENARQRALSGEQLNLATGAQDRFVNFGGQQAERTGRLSDLFLSGETPASLMPGSSELVMAEEQRQ